jgi:hypothetical protein
MLPLHKHPRCLVTFISTLTGLGLSLAFVNKGFVPYTRGIRDDAVGIATGYWAAEGSEFESRWRQDFSPLYVFHAGSGGHPSSYTIDTGGSFPWGKAAGAWSVKMKEGIRSPYCLCVCLWVLYPPNFWKPPFIARQRLGKHVPAATNTHVARIVLYAVSGVSKLSRRLVSSQNFLFICRCYSICDIIACWIPALTSFLKTRSFSPTGKGVV